MLVDQREGSSLGCMSLLVAHFVDIEPRLANVCFWG